MRPRASDDASAPSVSITLAAMVRSRMPPITLSCAFATSEQSHEHARIAEELGYARAWFYDSPALYPDVWVQLCRAAERTTPIGLGPGVLVPSLRHPMTNAAAIATLASHRRPGARRDRRRLGVHRPLHARQAADEVDRRASPTCRRVQALLRGEQVEWEGGLLQMLHPAGYGAPRPIEVPFIIAAAGPKGIAAAQRASATASSPRPCRSPASRGASRSPSAPSSPRARARTARARSQPPAMPRPCCSTSRWRTDRLDLLPNGEAWAAAYADVPASARHLALHDRHLIAINDRDRPFVTGELLASRTASRSRAAGWRERVDDAGVDGRDGDRVSARRAGHSRRADQVCERGPLTALRLDDRYREARDLFPFDEQDGVAHLSVGTAAAFSVMSKVAKAPGATTISVGTVTPRSAGAWIVSLNLVVFASSLLNVRATVSVVPICGT